MKYKLLRNGSRMEGFTLIELLLAMTLFSTVMVVATAGFIAMNRSFNRGVVRKELFEAVQIVNEDITRAVRAEGTKSLKTTVCATSGGADCPPGGWAALCLGRTRYVWKPNETGMFKDLGPCTATVTNNKSLVINERFRVKGFAAEVKNVHSGLVAVRGVFTTKDEDALTRTDPSDVYTTLCKGSAESSAVSTCAVENFQFLVSAQGGN